MLEIQIIARNQKLWIPLPDLPANVVWGRAALIHDTGDDTESIIPQDIPEADRPQHEYTLKLVKYLAYRASHRIASREVMLVFLDQIRTIYTGSMSCKFSKKNRTTTADYMVQLLGRIVASLYTRPLERSHGVKRSSSPQQLSLRTLRTRSNPISGSRVSSSILSQVHVFSLYLTL